MSTLSIYTEGHLVKLYNLFYTDTFNIQLWVLIFYHNFHLHSIQYTTSHHNIVYTLDQSIGEPHTSDNQKNLLIHLHDMVDIIHKAC